jgi:large subunit ribosomal protein L15e
MVEKKKKEAQKETPKENQKSVHGMYYYIKQAWKKPDNKILMKRMEEWRDGPAQVNVEKPLRLDRARALGYKDKTGFVIIRVRVKRGGHKRPRPVKGRRGKRMHTRKNLKMSYKWIAEQRVANAHQNLEVINSYEVGKDGIHYFYEVICVDPERPEIKNDKTINWIAKGSNRNRVFRGLTSSGKKSRGLRSKDPTSKTRPSRRAGQIPKPNSGRRYIMHN